MYDLGIFNGQIYQNGEFKKYNIYIKNGIIDIISKEKLECKDSYNALGKYVLPGFIDPHVHFDLSVGSYTSSDDFHTGSVAAAMGGNTTIIDFLDPVNSIKDLKIAYANRNEKALKCVIDYSFHTTISGIKDNVEDFIDYSLELGIPTIKFFTTYSSSNRRTYDNTIAKLIKLAKCKKILPIAHVENDDLIAEKNIKVKLHEKSRASICEISEVIKLAEMVEYYQGRLYIVHLNCGTTLNKLSVNYENLINKDIFIESCPHYMYFNSEIYNTQKGYMYTLTPPLRHKDEVDKLKKNIDYIDVIGTDHCPFYSYEKNKEYTSEIPMGIGGVEHSFSLMYNLFGEKIIDKFTEIPARIHGLYPKKGVIQVGSYGDITIFDPNKEVLIKNSKSKCDYDVYENIQVKGKVVSTINRGMFIVKDGLYIGGKGKYIPREVNY